VPDSHGLPTLARALRWVTFIIVEANAAFLLVYDRVRDVPSFREQAARYATAFQPAGFVHLICWLVGAGFFVFYIAALLPRAKRTSLDDPFVVPLAMAGTLASAWAVAFRNDEIGLALAFTAAATVIGALMFARAVRMASPHAHALRVPFALYFGWMSFALLVSVAQWLNARQWVPSDDAVLALPLLALATLAGLVVAAWCREFVYPAVVAWGAAGICVAQRPFEPLIAYAALGCAGVLVLAAATALVAAGSRQHLIDLDVATTGLHPP
jgi:hypothetical protein